ncbi:hypothetical protein BT63DRAFT_441317 [Microthyrium microscopicum]|uniref:Clr5 domain-containing protein n=1 Tax=Microthyrium microscopicum TaxID=703497 RepID=A0A6A6U622_9PEZI|nr:hypothetical protein BT63DRAFT_441317 [Microthyrium microscopicum]
MEKYKGEIFQLYIVQKKTLKDVITSLKRDHNINPSPQVLKTKIRKWGFQKNVLRSDVRTILSLLSHDEATDRDMSFSLRDRPVDLKRIENHRKREGMAKAPGKARIDKVLNRGNQAAGANQPFQAPVVVLTLQHYRAPEKLLWEVDVLIKGSFERGCWSFNGNDSIISSTAGQEVEVSHLHTFLSHLNVGSTAAISEDYELAGESWRKAFLTLETVVQGQYHDIIPNLLQKINDLAREGHGKLAEFLKQQIFHCSKILQGPNTSTSAIYQALGDLDMTHMPDIETRVMSNYHKLFEQYLGSSCYNSFVMMMNAARRRLLHDIWATFDECLPKLHYLDALYGPLDRRSLDVMCLRVETLNQRGLCIQAEAEALAFIRRAEMILEDKWIRFYNLTRGWFHLGSAQYFLGNPTSAIQSLFCALRSEAELCKLGDFNIFQGERVIIKDYLKRLGASNQAEDSLSI